MRIQTFRNRIETYIESGKEINAIGNIQEVRQNIKRHLTKEDLRYETILCNTTIGNLTKNYTWAT